MLQTLLAACVEPQGDAGHGLRGQPVLLAQPAGAFDRRMRQVARGMVFEEVGEEVKPGFGCGERGSGHEIRTVRQCEALDAFDNVGAARKSARGKARREQPVLRRLAGVERLAHRAELRFEPGRLRPGDAECRGGRLGIETEQPGAGRRGAKSADRAGRVKAEVVMARAAAPRRSGRRSRSRRQRRRSPRALSCASIRPGRAGRAGSPPRDGPASPG